MGKYNPYQNLWKMFYKNEASKVILYNDKMPSEFEYLKLKAIDSLNTFVEPVCSKTIYALHLIDGESTKSTPGVDCEQQCPVTLDLERDLKSDIYEANPEIQFFMYVMFERWGAIKLTSEGKTYYA